MKEYFKPTGEQNFEDLGVARGRIIANIEGIKRNLENGTYTIKKGHRVKGINPKGERLVLPLTERMIQNKKRNLEQQQAIIDAGNWRGLDEAS